MGRGGGLRSEFGLQPPRGAESARSCQAGTLGASLEGKQRGGSTDPARRRLTHRRGRRWRQRFVLLASRTALALQPRATELEFHRRLSGNTRKCERRTCSPETPPAMSGHTPRLCGKPPCSPAAAAATHDNVCPGRFLGQRGADPEQTAHPGFGYSANAPSRARISSSIWPGSASVWAISARSSSR